MRKFLILISVFCLLLTTGCTLNKYNEEVVAVVYNEMDTFEQAVPDEQLNAYYSKANEIGYNLFLNDVNESKIISPITLSNTILDLSQISGEDFKQELKEVMPDYLSYYDAKDFSKSSLQDLEFNRTLWLDSDRIPKYSTRNIPLNSFSDFEIFLVNQDANKSTYINEYVREKLGIDKDIVLDENPCNCSLVDINILNTNIKMKTEDINSEKKDFYGSHETTQKQYIIAKNVPVKYYSQNDINTIEFNLESKNDNLVLDILYSDNDDIKDNLLKDVNYESFITLVNNTSKSIPVTINYLEFPQIGFIYNCNNKDCFSNANLEFLYNVLNKDTKDSIISTFKIDQINQINSLNLYVVPERIRAITTANILEVIVNHSFVFVIRETTNNSILYIGNVT